MILKNKKHKISMFITFFYIRKRVPGSKFLVTLDNVFFYSFFCFSFFFFAQPSSKDKCKKKYIEFNFIDKTKN